MHYIRSAMLCTIRLTLWPWRMVHAWFPYGFRTRFTRSSDVSSIQHPAHSFGLPHYNSFYLAELRLRGTTFVTPFPIPVPTMQKPRPPPPKLLKLYLRLTVLL